MEFSKIDFKNPYSQAGYSPIYILFLIGVYLSISNKDWAGLFFTFCFLFIMILAMGVFTKIRFTKMGIESRSLFRRKVMEWNKIERYGVIKYIGRSSALVDRRDYDNISFMEIKDIFVSESPDFPFKETFFKGPPVLKFNYRREVWEELELRMKQVD